MGPLLTIRESAALAEARRLGAAALACSLDLGRTTEQVALRPADWVRGTDVFPYPEKLRPRTIYCWDGSAFAPVARFTQSLVKLVPTEWGPPVFEIDGIKMLVSELHSPLEDAARKAALIEPRGKHVLDCCGGLGYLAAACLEIGAARVISFEKSPDVLWLRGLNPWSPPADPRLVLTAGDCVAAIAALPAGCVDAILHDPPRFGIAGELYAQAFYADLARVLRPGGRLFHYTGAPNSRSRGRDLAAEVVGRLERAGFQARPEGDGVLARSRTMRAS